MTPTFKSKGKSKGKGQGNAAAGTESQHEPDGRYQYSGPLRRGGPLPKDLPPIANASALQSGQPLKTEDVCRPTFPKRVSLDVDGRWTWVRTRCRPRSYTMYAASCRNAT